MRETRAVRSHVSLGWVLALALILAFATSPGAHSDGGSEVSPDPAGVPESGQEDEASRPGDRQDPLIRPLYDEATDLVRAEFGPRVGLLSTGIDGSGLIIRIKGLTDDEQLRALAIVAAVSDSIDIRVVRAQYSESDLQRIVDAVAAEVSNGVPDASFSVGMSIDRSRDENDEIIVADLDASSVPTNQRADVTATLRDAASRMGGDPELLRVGFGPPTTPAIAVVYGHLPDPEIRDNSPARGEK